MSCRCLVRRLLTPTLKRRSTSAAHSRRSCAATRHARHTWLATAASRADPISRTRPTSSGCSKFQPVETAGPSAPELVALLPVPLRMLSAVCAVPGTVPMLLTHSRPACSRPEPSMTWQRREHLRRRGAALCSQAQGSSPCDQLEAPALPRDPTCSLRTTAPGGLLGRPRCLAGACSQPRARQLCRRVASRSLPRPLEGLRSS